MPRTPEWEIVALRAGLYDVVYDRRVVLAEVPDVQAWRYVRERRKDPEKVFEVEPDGYRFDVTRTLSRKR